MNKKAPESRSSLLLFFLVVSLLYLALFILWDRFEFSMIDDESHYWSASLSFSQSLVPSLNQLKNYNELSTPLPFIIFGYLEYLFHGGIFAGRLFNFALSFTIVCLIGMPRQRRDRYSILAACGLLLFPYYLRTSCLLYTDIIAAFFVILGFWFYTRDHHILSSISFTLAIASRQFMLAFPAAVAIFELIASLRNDPRVNIRWLAPTVAMSSILGWILLFGGLVPPETTEEVHKLPTQVPQNAFELSWLFPEHGLYFLACIGLYFVIPEWILFRRWTNTRSLLTRKNGYIALVLLLLFFIYPPLNSNGILIRTLRLFPSSFLQLSLLYILVFLVCVRFSRLNLVFWILLINCVVLMKGFAWDKYTLPVLVVLWYLKSIRVLNSDSSFTRR